MPEHRTEPLTDSVEVYEPPLSVDTRGTRWARELFATFDIRCEDGPVFDERTAAQWFDDAIEAGKREGIHMAHGDIQRMVQSYARRGR